MTAEACNACHLGPGNIKKSDSILTRIFASPKGYRVLGVITPIRNERDCSTADCHAHNKEQTVLGILDVMIPLDDTDKNLAMMKENLLLASLGLALILTIFTWLFLRRKPAGARPRSRNGGDRPRKS
jgi:histidine kinase